MTRADVLDPCTMRSYEYWHGLRGTMVLCNRKVISPSSPLLAPYVDQAKRFADDWTLDPNGPFKPEIDIALLRGPFVVSKQGGSDTLFVIREGRTYAFRLETTRADTTGGHAP